MRRWLPVSIIAGAWAFSLAVFSRLPETVPVHWGMSGEPNRYGNRIEAAFLMPALLTVFYLIMQWYPSRDPRAKNIEKFRGSYDIVVTTTVIVLTAIHVIALGTSLGWQVDITTTVLVAIGAMLIVLGNIMPRVRSNFIFGIRTPWTLSSDDVWMRSHRVGGYAMVAAGALTMVAAFFSPPVAITVALASALLSALVPVVYSYIAWSRERGDNR
jgi:uncharacterized membrane protein